MTSTGRSLIESPLASANARPVMINLAGTVLPSNELVKLYRAILNALPDKANHIIQIASAYEDEGTATIGIETAMIAATMVGKRALFIDTSTQRRGITKILSESIVPIDMLLASGKSPGNALAVVEGTNFYYAALRGHTDDSLILANFEGMETLIRDLRHSFDLIVIDSAAILSDTLVSTLCKLADACLLVIEAERTRAPVALQARRIIENNGGKVIGTVLNKRQFYIPQIVYHWLYRSKAA